MLFDLPKDEPSIIKIIGVGGGGSNAVTHMYKQGIVGVDYAICNTDAQAMQLSPVPTKISLGQLLTEGRGAGSKPSVGKQACLESLEDIKRFLDDGTKMAFITAGMGGGTGTGAAPIIAKTAQELGILTVGIVTLPFVFEGRIRVSNGMEGLEMICAKMSIASLSSATTNCARSTATCPFRRPSPRPTTSFARLRKASPRSLPCRVTSTSTSKTSIPSCAARAWPSWAPLPWKAKTAPAARWTKR